MKYSQLMSLLLLSGLTLTACKVVKDTPANETAIAADASGDDARTDIRIKETFDSKLIPHVRDSALPIAELQSVLANGLDAAGDAHGMRGAGIGAAWNFPVTGTGTVVNSKLDSRARWLGLDIDGDGSQDIRVQLGPVIKGTALRDVAPFYNFDAFRDQIEFAKLGRAINDQIKDMIDVGTAETPEDLAAKLSGKSVDFTGVIPLRSTGEAMVLTPIDVQVQP